MCEFMQGPVISPFASQLYQMPSDLKQQLEVEDASRSGGSGQPSVPQVSKQSCSALSRG